MRTYIALVDCDNFFVSCERLFRPELTKRPVLVLSSNDGCVISRSTEVKKLGVPMGEPYFKVRQLCLRHGVTIFSSNFTLYRDMSHRVMDVLSRFTDTMEAYSIDEAFLEFTPRVSESDTEAHMLALLKHIRHTVYREVGIPVSIGTAETKTLAKVATYFAKPARGYSGEHVLCTKGAVDEALATIPIGEVWGIGRAYSATLTKKGIKTALDLASKSDAWVKEHTTEVGLRTVRELRGLRCFPVGESMEVRKSLMDSESFGSKVERVEALLSAVTTHARATAETLRAEGILAKDLTVLLFTKGVAQRKRGVAQKVTLPHHTNDTRVIVTHATALVHRMFLKGSVYIKAGVRLGDIVKEGGQPKETLFGEVLDEYAPLSKAVDHIRHTHGEVLRLCIEYRKDVWSARHNFLSPAYTSRWCDIPSVPRDPTQTSL